MCSFKHNRLLARKIGYFISKIADFLEMFCKFMHLSFSFLICKQVESFFSEEIVFPSRYFVPVDILSCRYYVLQIFCPYIFSRYYVPVDIMSCRYFALQIFCPQIFCPVDILFLQIFCSCRYFVPVDILFLQIFCLCRYYVLQIFCSEIFCLSRYFVRRYFVRRYFVLQIFCPQIF